MIVDTAATIAIIIAGLVIVFGLIIVMVDESKRKKDHGRTEFNRRRN